MVPSRRERYDRCLFPEVFVVEIAPVPFEKRQIFVFKGPGSVMLKLPLDVLDGFRYLRDSNAKGAITLLPAKVSQFRTRLVDPA